MTSLATKMVLEKGTVSEPVYTTRTVNPTEREIATLAYQLWLDRGRPVGSDQELWFRAEEMLRDAAVARGDSLSRRPSISRDDTRSEPEIVVEFTTELWEGHWEVWEREWNCAHWVWDVRDSGVRVSNPANR